MFDYQKNPRLRFRFYLTALTLVFLFGSIHFYAETHTEPIRNAALTPETLWATVSEAGKSVEPAVVNIDTKGKVPDVSVKDDNLPNNKNSTEETLEDFLRRQRRPSYAVGSGFIVDKTGYILT